MIGMTPSVSWTKAGLWLCFFLGAKASVACDGDVLLACDMAGSSKQLETCLIGDRVRYVFGAADMPDLVLERHVRDVRVHQILEGTNEIMRLIVARRLLDDNAGQIE